MAEDTRVATEPGDLWAAVRADYLGGLSAPACCRRHGVGLSTLRNRAARDGWRRADQPHSPHENRLPPDDEGVLLEDEMNGDLERIDYRHLIPVADQRMMRATLRGDASEAMRWRRLRIALEADDAELTRWMEQDEMRAWALQDRDGRDGSDGVFSGGGVSADEP